MQYVVLHIGACGRRGRRHRGALVVAISDIAVGNIPGRLLEAVAWHLRLVPVPHCHCSCTVIRCPICTPSTLVAVTHCVTDWGCAALGGFHCAGIVAVDPAGCITDESRRSPHHIVCCLLVFIAPPVASDHKICASTIEWIHERCIRLCVSSAKRNKYRIRWVWWSAGCTIPSMPPW